MKEFVGKHFLLVVENNAVPFDKRVWHEALALKESGAKISIICPARKISGNKTETLEGITIHRFKIVFSDGSKKGYLNEYLTAFLKIFWLINKFNFSKNKVDVVHFANPPDIFWPIALYLKIFKIKFIFDEHDLSPETYLSKFGVPKEQGGMFYKLLKVFEYLSLKYATTVIATNESYRINAGIVYPKSLAKIFIVRNGPDTEKFHLVRTKPSLRKNKKYLMAYIGIMGVQDGVDYIINAAYYLVNYKKFTDFVIYLIGSGEDIFRLKELSRIYNLDEYIIFTGRIPDEPALEILSSADICLSPDPYNPLNDKSTMNKVMEYMTLGKPIVSFDLKEAKYSAKDAAIYVENNDIEAFANGIIKLINDPELRQKMGEIGIERVSKMFCWQRQISNLIDAYNFTLNKKRKINIPEEALSLN